jgi:PAS domain S-box-containing protein
MKCNRPEAVVYELSSGTLPLSLVLTHTQEFGLPVILITSIAADHAAMDLSRKDISGYVFRENMGQLEFLLRTITEKIQAAKEKQELMQRLQKSERYHQTLLSNINDFIFLFNESGDLVYQSPSADQLSGFSGLEGKQVVEYIFSEDRKKFLLLFKQVLRKPGARVKGQFRILHKAGHYIWIEGSIANLVMNEAIGAFVLCCRDITGRKQAETDLIQINRLYEVISHINQMIVAVQDEETLFKESCDIATRYGSFKMAYIGLLDEAETLWLIHSSGLKSDDEEPFKEIRNEENSALDIVLRTGELFVCNDVQRDLDSPYWREVCADQGFGSFIALPIRKMGKIEVVFVLAAEVDFFSDKEIALLEEAAGDISFKLDVLEKEKARLEAEAKLRHSELMLRQAQAIAHLGSWELDFATGIAEWSEESLRIYGIPEGQKIQSYEAWIGLVHPDDREEVLRISNEASRTCSSATFYHRILRADGTVRYIHSEAHFTFNEEGKPVGLHGIAHDITDLKLTEVALRESESRYSTLFYNSPQPIWLYDPETFRFVKVNKAAVDKYGYSEEEFCNMTIFDIRPKEDHERLRKFIRDQLSACEVPRDRQFRHYTKSGEAMIMEIYSNSVVLNDKTYKMVIGIDVTSINKYEDRVTSAIIQAQENERYEIGSELHDNVCQILATSLLKLSMLQLEIPARVIDSYLESKENILLAIREVRNISHRLAPASFNDSTLEDSVKLLINTYNALDALKITLHFSSAVNEYELSHEIKLNLYRIIQEQLNNIIKHSGATKATIEIMLISDCLMAVVADNGQGFDVTKVKCGIGMANMKRRAELFHGRIEVASTPGHGSSIAVTVPLEHVVAPLIQEKEMAYSGV